MQKLGQVNGAAFFQNVRSSKFSSSILKNKTILSHSPLFSHSHLNFIGSKDDVMEKGYLPTNNFRSLFPFSKKKFFTYSLQSFNRVFYELLARFYLAKKFIKNLRFFSSTRNLKYMTEKNLSMINDPIYFSHSDKVSPIKQFIADYCFDPSSLFTLVCIFINFLVTLFLFVYNQKLL